MRRRLAALFCLVPAAAAAAPVAIDCVGRGVDPRTGRQASAGQIRFSFEFDEARQTMVVTRGAPTPLQLADVSIDRSRATGSDGKWVYDVNRVAGTASVRADLAHDPESARLGLGGDYYRGDCASAGTAKF